MRSKDSRSTVLKPGAKKRRMALVALPTAAVLGLSLIPFAGAQSSLPGGSSLSDAFAPGTPPQRDPINTEYPEVEGLPEGVDISRVEYLTPRHLKVYIQSAAMPEKEQVVQILLARDWYSQPDKQFPEVWALDGLRARDDESGWTIETNIEQYYADKNVNVIMPVGGESSFYADWEKPDNGKHYKWETFLTQELVPILDNEYRSNKQRALVGISMGGTAAMNLAERHPYMFDFVGSFSGYLDTTSAGMPQAIAAAQTDAGGYTATNMWGEYGSQNWYNHDPKLGIEELKDMTVYVSAGSGQDDYGQLSSVAKGPANAAGVGLEVISRMSTDTFIKRAKDANVDVVSKLRPSGVHSWEYWQFEMTQAWPYIADTFGLGEVDRGSDCQPVGAIAEATESGVIGNCLNDEYDVEDGKAQDFATGTAYWSPETGARALFGRINARYAEIGGPSSWLGFPTTGETTAPDGVGRFVHFENGSIYWTPQTGAFAVTKAMMKAWGANGYESGDLKYPSGPVTNVEGGGQFQNFQNGVLVQTKVKKTQIVHGAIGNKYKEMGGANSEAGMPRGGEKKIKGGAFQEFENGNIYWSASTGAHFIPYGDIFSHWGQNGYETGKYGYPTSDLNEIPAGGLSQDFEGGTIRQIMGIVS
ncbi:alpha/beta hydrolase-fold protein [Corynebacterium casei]|uniref:alpha/beta hydrolase-fold protein n=1 Tax=Corynebacterium casei TaxID=160386 RepID=UPI003FD3B1B2